MKHTVYIILFVMSFINVAQADEIKRIGDTYQVTKTIEYSVSDIAEQTAYLQKHMAILKQEQAQYDQLIASDQAQLDALAQYKQADVVVVDAPPVELPVSVDVAKDVSSGTNWTDTSVITP